MIVCKLTHPPLLLDNRWGNLYKKKDEFKDQKVKFAPGKKPEVPDRTGHFKHIYAEDFEDGALDTLYTEATSGQKRFGGWNTVGITRYAHLKRECLHARKTKKNRQLEEAVLESSRDSAGIKAATHELHRASQGRKAHVEVAHVPTVNALDNVFDEEDSVATEASDDEANDDDAQG